MPPLNDLINGAFECAGGFFIWLSVRKLYQDKKVRGVSWPHVAFFSSWGFWNIWFYASLNQWFSWVGGLSLVLMNTFWLGQIVYYLWSERCQRA